MRAPAPRTAGRMCMRIPDLLLRSAAGVVGPALLIGCAEAAPSPPITVVRDSAGIEIVENAEAASPAILDWTLSAEPILQIGTIDGAAAYQLSRVRGVQRQADGRIVVADGGSREIRFYDGEGTHIRSVGRSGSGPGEFQELVGILAIGDSVIGYDMSQRRLTSFGTDGGLGGTILIEPAEESRAVGMYIASPAGMIEGDIVLVPNGGVFPNMGPAALVWEDFGSGHIFDRSGSATEVIGEPLGAAFFISPDFSTVAPFSRRTVFGFANERLYMADGATYEIRMYERGTTPSRVVRLARPPRPVTSELADRYLADRIATIPEERHAEFRERYSILQYPPHLPLIQALEVDDLDNLWVADYLPPWETEVASWSVFDADGRLLGALDLPAGLRVQHIGTDYILGVWTDDLGVEYVRMYGLSRGI